MNPRQRRGALLIGLSVVGAVAVFFAISGFVADINRQVGPMESVVRLTSDVAGFEPIPEESVEVVEMPARWKPPLAVGSVEELQLLVPATNLPAGTLIEAGDLTDPPSITNGQREIAILVDAETGVGGNIGVGDVVDIVATRQGLDNEPARAEIAVQGATILSLGATQLAEGVDPNTGAFAENEVVPITFVLPTSDVLRLAYVETFAATVRLALRSPLDDGSLDPQERVYAPTSSGGGGDQ